MYHQALQQPPHGCVKKRDEDKTDNLTILWLLEQAHSFYVISHDMGYRKSQHHREHHPSNMLEIQPVEGDEKENIDQRKQAPTCGLKEEIPGICFLRCLHQMEL